VQGVYLEVVEALSASSLTTERIDVPRAPRELQ